MYEPVQEKYEFFGHAPQSRDRESFGVSNLVGVPKLLSMQDPVMRAQIKVNARITASNSLTCTEPVHTVSTPDLQRDAIGLAHGPTLLPKLGDNITFRRQDAQHSMLTPPFTFPLLKSPRHT
jgi:hypothetical protein